jgi:hypothetical protein
MTNARALSVYLTPILFGIIVSVLLFFTRFAHAQSLDIKLDSSLSSGLMMGPNGNETSVRRAPIYLDFDAVFIFDGDHSIEWVLGSIIQTEHTPGFALNPQIRLRRKWKFFEGFVGAGLPFFIEPYTRFGTELSFGVSLPTSSSFAIVSQVSLQTFFMGSDLPEDHTVLSLNGAVGIRMRF